MTTHERLLAYNPNFSPQIVETVAEVADWQSSFDTYQEMFAAQGITDESVTIFDAGHTAVQVLDIKPKHFNEEEATIYHLPMATPIEPNIIYQAATISKANPFTRIIAVGNPSNSIYGHLSEHQNQLLQSDELNSLSPLVEPTLRYLDDQDISFVDHIAYSAGVDLALTALSISSQESSTAVLIEPVSIKKRKLAQLAIAFLSSNGPLESYVNATELDTFKQARKNSQGLISYSLGLKKPTNLAFARDIAKGKFFSRLANALDEDMQPLLSEVNIVWGTESELATDGILTSTLQWSHPFRTPRAKQLIHTTRYKGQKHAFANDIHLQAAIVTEGLTLAV